MYMCERVCIYVRGCVCVKEHVFEDRQIGFL